MYKTCWQASPCVKIVSSRPYSATLLATPAESRKACALNGRTVFIRRPAGRGSISPSARTAGEHRDEQKLRQRISRREYPSRVVVLHLQRVSFAGEHDVEAIVARRKRVRRCEPVVTPHRPGIETRING